MNPELLSAEKSTLAEFCEEECIDLHGIDVGQNREPFIEMDPSKVQEALRIALDSANYPLLISCTLGTNRTGCVVGCIRRVYQRWALAAVVDEFQRYNPKPDLLDFQFIECFEGY